MNTQKSRGPRILPCGILDCIVPTADNLSFPRTYCDLSDKRHDWKKGITEELFKYLIFAARLCGPLNRRLFKYLNTQLLQFRSNQ